MKKIDKLIEDFLNTGGLLSEDYNNMSPEELESLNAGTTAIMKDLLGPIWKDLSPSIVFGLVIDNRECIEYLRDFFKSQVRGSDALLRNVIISLNRETDSKKAESKEIEYYGAVFNNLCEFIKENNDITREKLYKKLKNLTEHDLTGDLELLFKVAANKVYENSFTKEGSGFRFPEKGEKDNESKIHNLAKGQLLNDIRNNDITASDIITDIKKNIEKYISDEATKIHKYDIIAKQDFGGVIKKGNIIEVKDIKYNDSYLAEPLASPVKMSSDEIRGDFDKLTKYNEIIDGLYSWLNSNKGNVGTNVITKLVKGLSGFFIHDNIYVPITEFMFYISNKGQNNCDVHRRIAIRYHIKEEAETYKLENGELRKLNKGEGISYTKTGFEWCKNEGKEPPKIIIDGVNLKKDVIVVKENTDYIGEYVNKLLDL
jgi:hypothetical protein